MSAISAASSGLEQSRALLDLTSQRIAEGYVSPEVVSAQELAKTKMDAQFSVLKEAIAAEAAILDLLV